MTSGSTRTPVTGHVGLNVSDLDRSKQFYREVFGFQVAGESQDPPSSLCLPERRKHTRSDALATRKGTV